jgi:hypothetical protein
MGFELQEFSILRVNAHNLSQRFSTRLGRYELRAESADISAVRLTAKQTLDLLISRVDIIAACGTDKKDELAVLTGLANELRELVQSDNEEQQRNAVLLLLGALIHRYFRLIKSYDPYNKGVSLVTLGFFNGWDLENCRLFTAIRAALQFSKEMVGDYRRRDLSVLDATTIVTSLEYFKEYMVTKGNYKKFKHLSKDQNFVPYLQALIEEHQLRGAVILKQFKAISFIESLASVLQARREHIESALDAWLPVFKKDLAPFSSLTKETIEAHIKTKIPGPVATIIINSLLSTPHMEELLEREATTLTHEQLVALLKESNLRISSFITLGGCSLLIDALNIDEKLRYCLFQMLGIEAKPEELSSKDKLGGIKMLIQFLEANETVVLETKFFGGAIKFNQKLLDKQQELQEAVNEALQEEHAHTM